MCLVKKVFLAASKYCFWALSFFFFYRYLKAIVTCGISCSSILYVATVKWKNSFDKTNFQKKTPSFHFSIFKVLHMTYRKTVHQKKVLLKRLSLLRSFIQLSRSSNYVPVQILLAVSPRLAMVRTFENSRSWE